MPRLLACLALGLMLVVVGVVVLPHRPSASPSTTVPAVVSPRAWDDRAEEASAVLDRLVAALAPSSSSRALASIAAPRDADALHELNVLRRNVRLLGVRDVTLRYLAPRPDVPVTSGPGGGTQWVGDVRLGWRLPGAGPSQVRIPVTFRSTVGAASFVTARRAAPGPEPLWLLAPVQARTTARSTVVTTRPGQPGRVQLARFSRLADHAVLDVRKVLTSWRGRLVLEVPGDQTVLARVLGAAPHADDQLAAVTTTTDGSLSPGAPVHVFVNPDVFGSLGPRGAQVVISHEATHVAADGARSRLPGWLLEGFADYVALAHAHLPVSVSASQVLARVRGGHLPARLPGAADFAADDPGLGASYEGAWLACRLIARTYGEGRLVAFYRAADRASSTTAAFRRVLGTDRARFTRAWRADLQRLAAAGDQPRGTLAR